MDEIKIKSKILKALSDTITPVSVFLKLRDIYPNSLLLESSDYHSKENSYSFICINPIITFEINNGKACVLKHLDNENVDLGEIQNFDKSFDEVVKSIDIQYQNLDEDDEMPSFNGFYGYIAYNSIQYFEDISLHNNKSDSAQIPSIRFSFFKNILAINHFKNEMTLLENLQDGDVSNLVKLKKQIEFQGFTSMPFQMKGDESSNVTDDEFIEMVKSAKSHCARGDVFQLVLSRQFKQGFTGDDFNVYRALRSINPSPYLFYFNYDKFNLMGSSPEAQIKVENNIALINPIAGTFKRSGNDKEDALLAEKLSSDLKENSEHVMLVDLARNDLSRNCRNVEVETFKEVQFFSHVIHLVSTVIGELKQGNSLSIVENTFPAGTLSGAPKYKAMQLIDKYENQDRGFYGGALGYIGLNGDVNLAIAIRSFVSKNGFLYSQAGAGVVDKSDENMELQEVNNKLSALKKALVLAENIS
jgi:anthranilate synthase component 1